MAVCAALSPLLCLRAVLGRAAWLFPPSTSRPTAAALPGPRPLEARVGLGPHRPPPRLSRALSSGDGDGQQRQPRRQQRGSRRHTRGSSARAAVGGARAVTARTRRSATLSAAAGTVWSDARDGRRRRGVRASWRRMLRCRADDRRLARLPASSLPTPVCACRPCQRPVCSLCARVGTSRYVRPLYVYATRRCTCRTCGRAAQCLCTVVRRYVRVLVTLVQHTRSTRTRAARWAGGDAAVSPVRMAWTGGGAPPIPCR